MNNETTTTIGQTHINNFSPPPLPLHVIIEQYLGILITLLAVGVVIYLVIYLVNLLRRIANSQEAIAKHLATLAAKNDSNGNK